MIVSNTKMSTAIPGMHGYNRKFDIESDFNNKDQAQKITDELVW